MTTPDLRQCPHCSAYTPSDDRRCHHCYKSSDAVFVTDHNANAQINRIMRLIDSGESSESIAAALNASGDKPLYKSDTWTKELVDEVIEPIRNYPSSAPATEGRRKKQSNAWIGWVIVFCIVFAVYGISSDSFENTPTKTAQPPAPTPAQKPVAATPPPPSCPAIDDEEADQELAQGAISLAGISVEVWGSYEITHVMYPGENWRQWVLIVPKDTSRKDLVCIAEHFWSRYPESYTLIFNNTTHLQQYVDRDRYFNDQTNTVPEVDFPDPEWVRASHQGNISNRDINTPASSRRWMFETPSGNPIKIFEG